MDLTGRKVMLVGGAGLIGSHIVDKLIETPVAEIVVFDNFVRGTRDNLAAAMRSPKVKLIEGSMTDRAALDAGDGRHRRAVPAGLAVAG